jgi:two-component system, chemotaxis family, CheB/CheR fusion protein
MPLNLLAEVFEALKEQVFEHLMPSGASSEPIRIWVAGCSTGEEVYSIAICLQEFLDTQKIIPKVMIFGTDISETVIEKARSGIYIPSLVEEQVSRDRLRRFFVKVEGGYEISKPIRQMCIFAKQNILADPPFSQLDLISCRNVLIYLGRNLQKQVLPMFHYSLKPTGFLLLGASESTGDCADLFAQIDKKQKIYSRKLTATRLNTDYFVGNYFEQKVNIEQMNSDASAGFDLQKEADRIVWHKYAPPGVIVNNELEIIQFRGDTSPYLSPAPGKPSFNLIAMAKINLRSELRSALAEAKRLLVCVRKSNISTASKEQLQSVTIEVIPLKAPSVRESYFLVVFEEVALPASPLVNEGQVKPARGKQIATSSQELIQLKQQLLTTAQELAATKDYLQSVIQEQEGITQELTTANEEILSSNEELQSTNEELQTAKEEIQATNEELTTTNDELESRILESTQINSDLRNLLSSVNIPIVMLGNDLRIRRFTPVAEKIFNLIPTDVGRPFSHIKPNINVSNLEQLITETIDTLVIKKQEVQDQKGHWYELFIRPYKTIENKIDGAVVMLVDIDTLKSSNEQIEKSRNYAEAIIETIPEPLVVLNANLQVNTANRFFYSTFQVTPAQTENRSIFELGNGQWNNSQLRSLLQS